MKDKIYGVIMAGGGGTRFWPLSRKNKPKQLLNLTGKDLMINETLGRLNGVVDNDNLYIVTANSQAQELKKVVSKSFRLDNLLTEPAMRNTSACIGYAIVKILDDENA